MVRVSVLTILALVGLSGVAGAQPPPGEAAKNMVGGWEISNAERDRRCPLTFSIDPTPGGFKLEFDPDCRTAFPTLDDVVAWNFGPKDTLHLYNAKGGTVLEFAEVENGMFESERGADGLLFLQTQTAVKVETRTAEQMLGDWHLLREADKPLCRLTLAAPAQGTDSYRVVMKPGCDKTIAAFGLTSWRLDRDQLVLTGRGGTWRFAESDATVWERVPLSTDPLLLVRQ